MEKYPSVAQDTDIENGIVTASDTLSEKQHHVNQYANDLSDVQASQGWFGSLVRYTRYLRIEERGIERVREEDRYNQSVLTGFTMWASANFTPSTFATGLLGPVFGLGFWDSFAIIVIINFTFSWIISWFGLLGPQTGLRAMSISRFSFGIWGLRVLVILNLCGAIGWSSVNAIAGAQVLNELSDGNCPLWAGNLIIGVCTGVICFFGYYVVHTFEKYCWIAQLFSFIFVAGYGAKHFDASALPMGSGGKEASGAMSFIASIYGFVIGWASAAPDYNVRMPVNTNRTKLVLATWAGNFFGTTIPEVLGAAFMTAVAKDQAFADAYDNRGVGGLMGQALKPLGGFGKFLLVLLTLSIVGCNLISNYSLAFMCQNFHPALIKVPRFVWTILGTAAVIAISIAAANTFIDVMESFLSVIGYYGTPFVVVLVCEHYIFRGGQYPLDDWNNMDVMPYGIAGVFAIGMGFVGAVLSMNQTWYVGVVSRAIHPPAELGWIFSGAFSGIGFVPVRWLERRFTGR